MGLEKNCECHCRFSFSGEEEDQIAVARGSNVTATCGDGQRSDGHVQVAANIQRLVVWVEKCS
jgi:hypothetical protein